MWLPQDARKEETERTTCEKAQDIRHFSTWPEGFENSLFVNKGRWQREKRDRYGFQASSVDGAQKHEEDFFHPQRDGRQHLTGNIPFPHRVWYRMPQ